MTDQLTSLQMRVVMVRDLFAALDDEIGNVTRGGHDLDWSLPRSDVLMSYRTRIAEASGPSASWPPDDAVVTIELARSEWLDLYGIAVAVTELCRDIGEPLEGDAALLAFLVTALDLTSDEMKVAQRASDARRGPPVPSTPPGAPSHDPSASSPLQGHWLLDLYREQLFVLAGHVRHLSFAGSHTWKLADEIFNAASPANDDLVAMRRLLAVAKAEINRRDTTAEDMDNWALKDSIADEHRDLFDAFEV